MDKAKAAVSNFMSHKGEHNTVVDQDHRAAVTEEQVRPERHEHVTTAVDKEVHQDHHQTVIQPISHTEKLEDKHTHNVAPVEHRSFDHDSPDKARDTLDTEAAQYRDTSVVHDTKHTTTAAPQVEGEHVHHHLHQHVQPVIQKETIAPEHVHTTIPIHETHHAPTVHHGTTTLPAKSLSEFEGEHGLKGESATTVGEFDGCAKPVAEGKAGQTGPMSGAHGHDHAKHGHVGSEREEGLPAAGGMGSSGMEKDGLGSGAHSQSADYKVANQAANKAFNDNSSVPRSSATGQTSGGTGSDNLHNIEATKSSDSKVPLKDKLNPFKDADGDGKKGLMS